MPAVASEVDRNASATHQALDPLDLAAASPEDRVPSNGHIRFVQLRSPVHTLFFEKDFKCRNARPQLRFLRNFGLTKTGTRRHTLYAEII